MAKCRPASPGVFVPAPRGRADGRALTVRTRRADTRSTGDPGPFGGHTGNDKEDTVTRATMAGLAALALTLTLALGAVGLAAAPVPLPVAVHDGQLCAQTTCVDRAGHVVTYQPEPDWSSAPPAAGR